MENKNEDYITDDSVMDLEEKENELLKTYSDSNNNISEEEKTIEEVKEQPIVEEKVTEVEPVFEATTEEVVEPVVEEKPTEVETIIQEMKEESGKEEKIDKRYRRTKRIINIVFIVIMLILVAIATDVICVSKFQKGPFFAIPLHTYKDGGSKEYYGLGYKVIKYHQTQGRRDKEIGSWALKYNANPITVEAVDMAIEYYDNPTKATSKYQKKFVRVISTLNKKNIKNNSIEIGYDDEGGKYALDITCNLVDDHKDISKLKENEEITIIGVVSKYEPATKKKANKLTINNCFAEQ